jgi:hypothetical protein
VNVEVRMRSLRHGHEVERGYVANNQEMSTGHQVVDTRGPPDGRFTFTSHEAGKWAMGHRIMPPKNEELIT